MRSGELQALMGSKTSRASNNRYSHRVSKGEKIDVVCISAQYSVERA
jgi:hypothetical protein